MQVVVEQVRWVPGETVITAVGVELETGDRVLFAGDHRPMAAIAEAFHAGQEEILADVPDWAVLARDTREA